MISPMSAISKQSFDVYEAVADGLSKNRSMSVKTNALRRLTIAPSNAGAKSQTRTL